MDITYRIPSKKVPYGYLEFSVKEGESLPDPVKLAEDYAQYIKDYQAAEILAFENPAIRQIKRADAVSEDINEVAAREIKSQLGATELDGDDPEAPWNKNDDEPTTSKTAVSDDDWDFD